MLKLYEKSISSRLLQGTAGYPTLENLLQSIEASGTEVLTLTLRRTLAQNKSSENFWSYLRKLGKNLLPNTAGCYTAHDAVQVAHMSRELFDTNWIKLEIHRDSYTLLPNMPEALKAAEILIKDGFHVFPYMTDEIFYAEKLVQLGCRVLMPLAAPIGSGQGIVNPSQLSLFRKTFIDATIIVDAGIGAPSHACLAMEMGLDAILLNTAIAKSDAPVAMAQAFSSAIAAGRVAFESGLMPVVDFARPSTPTVGIPFHV